MFVCVILKRSVLVFFPLVGFYGRQEWVRKGFHVSSFASSHQLWRIFSRTSIQQLVHRNLDPWHLHWLVDYQLDFSPLL